MTPVWIRAAQGIEWHRLTIVGVEHHGVACILSLVPTDEPVLVSSNPPDKEPRCSGCARDLECKQARAADARVRVADFKVEPSRVPTVDLRGPWTLSRTTTLEDEWDAYSETQWRGGGVPERLAMADLVSGPVGRGG